MYVIASTIQHRHKTVINIHRLSLLVCPVKVLVKKISIIIQMICVGNALTLRLKLNERKSIVLFFGAVSRNDKI